MSPPAPATISNTRMKTYFTVVGSASEARARRGSTLPSGAASSADLLGAGTAEDLPDRRGAIGQAVHGDAEAVVGEARVEGPRRREPWQAPEHHHADDRRDAAEIGRASWRE